MSLVTTRPEALFAAPGNLPVISADVSARNAAAASPTTAVGPAAADQVSALTAAQFTAHTRLHQAVSARGAAIHRIASTLSAGAGSYAATEAANTVITG